MVRAAAVGGRRPAAKATTAGGSQKQGKSIQQSVKVEEKINVDHF